MQPFPWVIQNGTTDCNRQLGVAVVWRMPWVKVNDPLSARVTESRGMRYSV